MVQRGNHYEAAFEAYLRKVMVPYVAVDETRRSLSAGGSLKNPDFIVSPDGAARSFVVDVKGRRFPSGKQKQYWRNWATLDDLRSLARWEATFGKQFTGLLVFAYNIVGDRAPLPPDRLFRFRECLYAFVGVKLVHYVGWAHRISERWDTYAISAARFRDLAEPVDRLFGIGVFEGERPDAERAPYVRNGSEPPSRRDAEEGRVYKKHFTTENTEKRGLPI